MQGKLTFIWLNNKYVNLFSHVLTKAIIVFNWTPAVFRPNTVFIEAWLYHRKWDYVYVYVQIANRGYDANRRDQFYDLIFNYLTVGIISNMSLFLYNANILLYMLGEYSNIYNNWVLALVSHSKIEALQFWYFSYKTRPDPG